MEDILLRFVPAKSPLLWVIINALCLLYTIVTFIVLFVAEEEEDNNDTISSSSAIQEYSKYFLLEYDYITTIIWCIEVGLNVWYSSTKSNEGINWIQRIEIMIAVYFLFDSGYEFYCNRIIDVDIDESIIEVIVCILAYAYVLFDTTMKYHHRQTQQQQQQQQQREQYQQEQAVICDTQLIPIGSEKIPLLQDDNIV